MKGLELSEKYFNEVLYPLIRDKFPNLKISCGLIGYGSECYGYDDNISRDHDFSVMPCIWLNNEDYIKYAEELKKELDRLPKEYMGYKVLDESVWGKGRRGVLNIEEYIYMFLGTNTGPIRDIDYRNIPQYLLSSFTNGKIFLDEEGTITKLRERIKFYPRDIKFNMLATRCMQLNASFINYERCLKRNMKLACNQAMSLFIKNATELYFLLNNKYCPYYKWQHKMLSEIDSKAYSLLLSLLDEEITDNKRVNIMDAITNDIIDRLEKNRIIVRVVEFIGYYGPVIQSRIENEEIKNIGCWSD